MFVRLIFETKKKERRGLMTMYVIFDWLPFLDFDFEIRLKLKHAARRK